MSAADVSPDELLDAGLAMLTRQHIVSIPLKRTPSKQLSLSGRHTVAIRNVAPGSFEPAEYSSHECVGDISDAKPRAQRACLFRRVCIRADGSFTYHRHPNASQLPFVFDRRKGHQHGLKNGTEAFVGLNKHARYKRHARWSPTVVSEPLPPQREEVQQLHLLSAPFVPTNLGHVIWEEAFPLLLAMAQLGVYTETPAILRTVGCGDPHRRARRESPPVRLCRKFEAGFLWPLLGRNTAWPTATAGGGDGPGGTAETDAGVGKDAGAGAGVGAGVDAGAAVAAAAALPTLQELALRLWRRSRHRPTCFARVLAGGYHDVFGVDAHPGKEPLLALYRHRVLSYHGIDPAGVPRQHAALLLRKHGKRNISNVEEVGRYVQAGCRGQCEELAGRTTLMSPQKLTVREQLAAISSTTLAISPPGAVSMALPFLPDGACVILVNYQEAQAEDRPDAAAAEERIMPSEAAAQSHLECQTCSWTMEAELWRQVRHVHRLHYQVWEDSDFVGGRPGRDASVIIKAPRLTFLIRAALNEMASPSPHAA